MHVDVSKSICLEMFEVDVVLIPAVVPVMGGIHEHMHLGHVI